MPETEIKVNSVSQEYRNISGEEWRVLGAFVLGAFLLRLFMLRYEYMLSPDGVYYALLGKSLVSGNFKEGLSTYWPPLYPLLVGLSSVIFQDLEFGGRFVSVLAGSLLVIPVYLWIRSTYGRDVASVGAFFTIVYPSLIRYSTQLLTESTYTLLFVIGILTGWSALSKGNRSAFLLTGLVFGACYLIRPEAIGYVGLMIIFILSTKLFNNQLNLKRILLNNLYFVLGFAILAFPYILYLHQETGKWAVSGKGVNISIGGSEAFNIWFRLSEDGQTTLADRVWAGSRWTENYSDIRWHTNSTQDRKFNLSRILVESIKGFKSQYEVVIPRMFPPLLILLAGLGLFRARWPKERVEREFYLLLFFTSTLMGYALTLRNPRYLVPLMPLFIFWVSKGIVELEDWLIETGDYNNKLKKLLVKNQNLIRPLIVTVVFFSLLPAMTYPMRGHKLDQPLEQKRAAVWIKNHSDSAPLIMSTGPWAAFYAGGKHIYLPDEEYSVLIDYARHKKVDYIIVDERWVPKLTPHLRFLLDEQSQLPELKLVYKDEITNYKVFIFRLRD